MNDEQAREVEVALRELLAEAGLGWVLVQIDTSVGEGVAESASSRSATDDFEYWPGIVPDRPRGGSRGKPDLTSRPLVAGERVHYLLAALERLFIELPGMEAETRTILDQGVQGRLPMISGLSFRTEGDGPVVAESAVNAPTSEFGDRLEAVQDLIRQLRDEVDR